MKGDYFGRKPRVYLPRDWSMETRRLVVVRDTKPGKCEVLDDFTWTEHDEGDAWFGQEGIARADELIQAIVDRAWEEGFRPSGFADIKNETAALREHLSDMKIIAFHQLKIGTK